MTFIPTHNTVFFDISILMILEAKVAGSCLRSSKFVQNILRSSETRLAALIFSGGNKPRTPYYIYMDSNHLSNSGCNVIYRFLARVFYCIWSIRSIYSGMLTILIQKHLIFHAKKLQKQDFVSFFKLKKAPKTCH